ncbi:hypothetical protein DCE79_14670 [Lysinibacillus sp. 2017]|uniref:hypothetical protein n=1 Tax=unclassified Lysinibacillus TaxID=2636778 RepID=UPI000D529682|nr:MULTISPECIES: hypothetical protein [unclassified Lysinibacillus]AWE08535.1 hypothetical protein DCE79_14670 [Lysinibacillus sp. 2017]TGN35627.1 hypothetical protein E4L99_08490 [Lysinibacillus sp. S2017]
MKLIANEKTLIVQPILACVLGVDEAILLQQLHLQTTLTSYAHTQALEINHCHTLKPLNQATLKSTIEKRRKHKFVQANRSNPTLQTGHIQNWSETNAITGN